ncbi:MAG: hypothetical protein DI620_02045 [Haemophilus parainfluenzae]|nr:MAG: hypothetical protein DI620_02045 [Haemophilus parainfluenzae]
MNDNTSSVGTTEEPSAGSKLLSPIEGNSTDKTDTGKDNIKEVIPADKGRRVENNTGSTIEGIKLDKVNSAAELLNKGADKDDITAPEDSNGKDNKEFNNPSNELVTELEANKVRLEAVGNETEKTEGDETTEDNDPIKEKIGNKDALGKDRVDRRLAAEMGNALLLNNNKESRPRELDDDGNRIIGSKLELKLNNEFPNPFNNMGKADNEGNKREVAANEDDKANKEDDRATDKENNGTGKKLNSGSNDVKLTAVNGSDVLNEGVIEYSMPSDGSNKVDNILELNASVELDTAPDTDNGCANNDAGTNEETNPNDGIADNNGPRANENDNGANDNEANDEKRTIKSDKTAGIKPFREGINDINGLEEKPNQDDIKEEIIPSEVDNSADDIRGTEDDAVSGDKELGNDDNANKNDDKAEDINSEVNGTELNNEKANESPLTEVNAIKLLDKGNNKLREPNSKGPSKEGKRIELDPKSELVIALGKADSKEPSEKVDNKEDCKGTKEKEVIADDNKAGDDREDNDRGKVNIADGIKPDNKLPTGIRPADTGLENLSKLKGSHNELAPSRDVDSIVGTSTGMLDSSGVENNVIVDNPVDTSDDRAKEEGTIVEDKENL